MSLSSFFIFFIFLIFLLFVIFWVLIGYKNTHPNPLGFEVGKEESKGMEENKSGVPLALMEPHYQSTK
jgi:hypothetical protein